MPSLCVLPWLVPFGQQPDAFEHSDGQGIKVADPVQGNAGHF